MRDAIRNVMLSKRHTRPNVNSASGIRGVWWSKRGNRWIATIGVNGEQIYLGCFKELEQAVMARRDAEREYWK